MPMPMDARSIASSSHRSQHQQLIDVDVEDTELDLTVLDETVIPKPQASDQAEQAAKQPLVANDQQPHDLSRKSVSTSSSSMQCLSEQSRLRVLAEFT